MNPVITVLALWIGTTLTAAAGVLWLANRETLAELPDTAPHDPAACEVCCWASDVGVIAAIDFDRWAHEMQEHKS